MTKETYPWLDEGINTYFDNWFDKEISSFKSVKLSNQITDNLLLATFEQWRVDQPLSVKSDGLTEANYGYHGLYKRGAFIKVLEQKFGKEQLQNGLKYYFENGKANIQPLQILNLHWKNPWTKTWMQNFNYLQKGSLSPA